MVPRDFWISKIEDAWKKLGGPACLAGFVKKISDGSIKDWDMSTTQTFPKDF